MYLINIKNLDKRKNFNYSKFNNCMDLDKIFIFNIVKYSYNINIQNFLSTKLTQNVF